MTSRGTLTRWIDFILAKPLRHFIETPRRVLKGYIKKGMTVLDAGCGSGHYSLGMARLVGSKGKVVSLDTRIGAIEALEKRATQKNLLDRFELRVCKDQDLEMDHLAGQVDFALAVYVVHHVSDAARFMKEVHTSLKPGGIFLVIEPRHHASASECSATEAAALKAGFAAKDHPHLKRDWAVSFIKEEQPTRWNCKFHG